MSENPSKKFYRWDSYFIFVMLCYVSSMKNFYFVFDAIVISKWQVIMISNDGWRYSLRQIADQYVLLLFFLSFIDIFRFWCHVSQIHIWVKGDINTSLLFYGVILLPDMIHDSLVYRVIVHRHVLLLELPSLFLKHDMEQSCYNHKTIFHPVGNLIYET